MNGHMVQSCKCFLHGEAPVGRALYGDRAHKIVTPMASFPETKTRMTETFDGQNLKSLLWTAKYNADKDFSLGAMDPRITWTAPMWCRKNGFQT